MSDGDHTPPDQQVPPARPTPPGESTIARPVAAVPPAPASSGNDRDAAATDDARAAEPSTALVDPAPLPSLLRLYALVALAYAQRLATVEEQARAANDGQQALSAALAGVRARLARLEERQDTRAGVDAQRLTAALDAFQDAQEDSAGREDTQERRRTERRSFNAMWSARERRRAERRKQDRERLEEAVMAQYIPPAPALVPPATDQEAHMDATPAPPTSDA